MDLNAILAIVALVTSAVSTGALWGVMTERMKNMKERQDKFETEQKEQAKELVSGRVRFERIEGKLDTIHDDVSDLKKMLQQAIPQGRA